MCIFFKETETPNGGDRGCPRECHATANVLPPVSTRGRLYLVVEDCNPNAPAVSGAGSVYQDEEYVSNDVAF